MTVCEINQPIGWPGAFAAVGIAMAFAWAIVTLIKNCKNLV